MAAFCSSCGSPLAEGTRFCEKCGAAVTSQPGAAVAGPTPVSPAPAPVAPKGTSTVVKVIIAILAVFMFLGLLVVGSCFYVLHRARHELSKAMSVPPYTGKREPCAMLTTDEASSALGQPISSAEPFGPSICRYSYGSDGSRQLNVQYTWQGGAIAMGVTDSVMKHMSGAQTLTPLDGIGDEAYLGPMGSTLMMRKGDVMVNMDLRVSGVSAEAAKKMAKIIGDRL